ncbi:Alpha/beta hydrolase [Azospirillaceae bacterium]
MPFVSILEDRLEYFQPPPPPNAPSSPVLVFLHEGLGSIELWRDFPERLAAAVELPALIYSRAGFGRSSPLTTPRDIRYLEREASESLPTLLETLNINHPILIGHSDGGSIALLYAAQQNGPRPLGVIAEAAHVFVEDISITGIRNAVKAWQTTDLPQKLARRHNHPEAVFRAWSDTWLAPWFRSWNIERALATVTCPTLIIQGDDDEYGTSAQVEAIRRAVAGPAQTLMIPHCGHTPHRDQPDVVCDAITKFIRHFRKTETKTETRKTEKITNQLHPEAMLPAVAPL